MKIKKTSDAVNFNDMSLNKLSEYIVKTHHLNLKEAIYSFGIHLKTILKIDSIDHPEVISIAEQIMALNLILEQHLSMEEQMLFPYINSIIQNNKDASGKLNGLSQNLVAKIQKEHSQLSQILIKIRTLSKNYTPSVNSSPTLKLCYAQMFDLEQDLHKHVFIEENILFPKLIEHQKKMFGPVSKTKN